MADPGTVEKLIDTVTANTQGTAGDPLTRDEVAQIVHATLDALPQYYNFTGDLPNTPPEPTPGGEPPTP